MYTLRLPKTVQKLKSSSCFETGKSQEKGIALLELALALPLLLIAAVNVYDVARIYLLGSTFAQVAREGARVASATKDLEEGTCSYNGSSYKLDFDDPAPEDCGVSPNQKEVLSLTWNCLSVIMLEFGGIENAFLKVNKSGLNDSVSMMLVFKNQNALSNVFKGYTLRITSTGGYL